MELVGQSLNDKLRGVMNRRPAAGLTGAPGVVIQPPAANGLQSAQLNRMEDKIDQLLELGVSAPEYAAPGQNFEPASVPGVRRGGPLRESSYQRAERERLGAEQRVRDLDTVDDPSIVRDAEFVSG